MSVRASGSTGAEEVSDVESNDLELRLSGLPTPDGEISLADLAAIAAPLQELATRVGRYVAEQSGPGRSLAAVENATRLRLRGVMEGSTRLLVGYGQTDVLEIDNGLQQSTADRFWEVIEGISTDRRPSWTTPGIDDSALKLLDGLRHAGSVEVSRHDGRTTRFTPPTASREVWLRTERVTDTPVVMVGWLKAVDLDSGRFRLTDDVGNRIPLVQVLDPEAAAALVGRRVAASGHEIRGPLGEFRGVQGARLRPVELPSAWLAPAPTDLAKVLSRPGPDPEGGDLTDDEFAAFMAALKG